MDDASDDYLERFLNSAFSGVDEIDAAPLSERRDPPPVSLGRFRVIEMIGEGGIGIVYRVEDDELGRELAAKVIRAERAKNPDLRRRFIEEAKICSRLQHPGVVPVHQIGETEDGRPYFTMKLVAGATLDARLAGRDAGQLPSTRDLELFERLCQAVAYAHSHGVIHGDLKPQNVMVGEFGELQVMDWGFARLEDEFGGSETPPASRVMGTPAYMAPEQSNTATHAITKRTDVFGLGAILCEILTGAPPYLGDSKAEVVATASTGNLGETRGRLERSHAEAAVVDLALRCLDPDPSNRPSDAAEVAGEVARFLARSAERSRALELETAEARAIAAESGRRRRLTIALASVVVTTVLIGAATLVWIERDRNERRTNAERNLSAVAERATILIEQGAWPELQIAKRELVAYVKSPELTPTSIERATDLIARMTRELELAERDARLTESLTELRPHFGDTRDFHQIDRAYAALFRDRGIDVERNPEVASEMVRGSRNAGPLLDALDVWVHHRRQATSEEDASWRLLVKIANGADDDPWRRSVRRAYEQNDVSLLRRLAETRDPDASPNQLDLLARFLADRGELELSIAIYREATARYPGDSWLHQSLAGRLNHLSSPPLDEIRRHLAMAVAIEPNRAVLRADLAFDHYVSQRFDLAMFEARAARKLDPNYARAAIALGLSLLATNQAEAAVPVCREALALGEEGAYVPLATALLRVNQPDAAIKVAREGVDVQPTNLAARLVWVALLVDDYRYTEAIDATAGEFPVDPLATNVYGMRAIALAEIGRFDEAVASFHIARDASVDAGVPFPPSFERHAEVLRDYASIARDLEGSPGRDAAIRLSEQPDAPSLATIAQVAFRLGDHKLALRLLDDAWADNEPVLRNDTDLTFLAARAAARVANSTGSDVDREALATWAGRAFAAATDDWDRLIAAGATDINHQLRQWRREPFLGPMIEEDDGDSLIGLGKIRRELDRRGLDVR